jgi:hypothetical protein
MARVFDCAKLPQECLPRASTMIYEGLLIITLGDDRGCTLGSFVGIYLDKTCSI